MAKKCLKKYSTPLVEMEIKTWDVSTYPLEWLKMKSLTISSVDKDAEEVELAYIAAETEIV